MHKLATEIGLPVVVIGEAGEAAIAGTIPCIGRSYRLVAALIRWSAYYLGPDFGMSWIASTTGTPMGIFTNSANDFRARPGFVEILDQERECMTEWDPQTSTESVIEHIAARVQTNLIEKRL